MDVGPQRVGNGGHGEQEVHQRGETGHEAADWPEGPRGKGKRPACLGDGGGEFGVAEDERDVHHRDQQRGHQEPDGARRAPAVVPAEILAGDDHAHGQGPQLHGVDFFLEGGFGFGSYGLHQKS